MKKPTEPTQAMRPIAPEDWDNNPQDFEAHLEAFAYLKDRPLWTGAELGALCLLPLKLEMLLSQTTFPDLVKTHPGLDDAVRRAVAAGQIETIPDGDRVLLVPASAVAWALSQGHELPAEIATLAVRSGAGDSQDVDAQGASYSASRVEAWARIEQGGNLSLTGKRPDGTKVEAVFQQKSFKTGTDSRSHKLMQTLAYYRGIGVSIADVMKEFFPLDDMKANQLDCLKILCDLVNDTSRKLTKAGFPYDTLNGLCFLTLKKLHAEKGNGLANALKQPLRLNFRVLHCDDTLTKTDSRAGNPRVIDKNAYLTSRGVDPSDHSEDFGTPEAGEES